MPFSVREPSGPRSPLVVEVPHAGLQLDARSLVGIVAPAQTLARDADLYVDELFAHAPDAGAALLVAHQSRYVVDLNRAESDIDAQSVQGGPSRNSPRGLIWHTTTDNRPVLARPLSPRELERRLETLYRPYHAALSRLLDARRREFGFALLLCGHSMPSRGRDGHHDPGRARADIVPGSRGRTSASPVVIDALDAAARDAGFDVIHDQPYRGGFSTEHYGRPALGTHAIQIEINRRLYLDEGTLERDEAGFTRVQTFCTELVRRLAALRLR